MTACRKPSLRSPEPSTGQSMKRNGSSSTQPDASWPKSMRSRDRHMKSPAASLRPSETIYTALGRSSHVEILPPDLTSAQRNYPDRVTAGFSGDRTGAVSVLLLAQNMID